MATHTFAVEVNMARIRDDQDYATYQKLAAERKKVEEYMKMLNVRLSGINKKMSEIEARCPLLTKRE